MVDNEHNNNDLIENALTNNIASERGSQLGKHGISENVTLTVFLGHVSVRSPRRILRNIEQISYY